MDEALVERIVRSHLHAEARALAVPAALYSRILRTVRADASGRAFEDEIASRLRVDAEGVHAPRDTASRIRNAVRDRETRRIRFSPKVAPSSAFTTAAALASGTSTIAPRPTNAIFPTCLPSSFDTLQMKASTAPGRHRDGSGSM